MLAATLARLILAMIDIVTLPFRMLLALLPGHRFHVAWLTRRVPVARPTADGPAMDEKEVDR